MLQDMLWSVLPGLDMGGHRQPRKAVATAVRLLLFGVGCCIAFAVSELITRKSGATNCLRLGMISLIAESMCER